MGPYVEGAGLARPYGARHFVIGHSSWAGCVRLPVVDAPQTDKFQTSLAPGIRSRERKALYASTLLAGSFQSHSSSTCTARPLRAFSVLGEV